MRLSSPTSKTKVRPHIVPYDVAWIIVAPAISLALREPRLIELDPNLETSIQVCRYLVTTIVCAFPALMVFRVGDSMTRYFSAHDMWSICAASGVASSASAALTFVFDRLDSIPRSTPLIYAIVLALGLAAGRLVAIWRGTDPPSQAANDHFVHRRRVILVGVDRFASQLIRLIDCQLPRTVQIIAALDDRDNLVGRTVNGVKIVGIPADLRSIIEEYSIHGVSVDEVWVSDSLFDLPAAAKELDEVCVAAGVSFASISGALNLRPTAAAASRTGAPRRSVASLPIYFKIKRAIDILVAAALLCFLSPVAATVAGFVFFDVGAPVIFWQERIGRNGRKFLLYKFRTYRAPFDHLGRSIPEEERLSRIGRAVRATRLDEIPQLVNILRGHMSLIGPRPLLPVDQPNDPLARLAVSPGVTGWAQVNGGNLITAEEKDALDVWYIRNASLGLDLKIALRTLGYFFRGEVKNNAALEEALRWRHKIAEIDNLLFTESATTNGHEKTYQPGEHGDGLNAEVAAS
jgi:lipopolysaccharide/colanic/teichoic acid biosynthesis glycosyltransferase